MAEGPPRTLIQQAVVQAALSQAADPEATFTFFDLETPYSKGEYPTYVAEYGAVKVRGGKVIGRFHALAEPQGSQVERELGQGVTGALRRRYRAGGRALSQKEALKQFLAFSQGTTLVGHGISEFDVPVLQRVAKGLGVEANLGEYVIDTLEAARYMYPNMRDRGLGSLAEAFSPKGATQFVQRAGARQFRHRAMADVAANVRLFGQMLNEGFQGSMGSFLSEHGLTQVKDRVTAIGGIPEAMPSWRRRLPDLAREMLTRKWWTGKRIAGAAAIGAGAVWLGNHFSGHKDAYNDIEGMQELGLAGAQRKVLTDFGSGYRGFVRGVKSISKRISDAMSISRRFAKGFAAQEAKLGGAGSQYVEALQEALVQSGGQRAKVAFHSSRDALLEAYAAPSLNRVSASIESPPSILAHEFGHLATRWSKRNSAAQSALEFTGPLFAAAPLLYAITGDIDPENPNPLSSYLFYGLAPLAFMGPRLVGEARASLWGLKTLRNLGYQNMGAATKTLGAAFGTYAEHTLRLTALGLGIRAYRGYSVANNKTDLLAAENVVPFKLAGSLVAGGSIIGGLRYGWKGAGIGAAAGMGAAGIMYAPRLLFDENSRARQVSELAGIGLAASAAGSAMSLLTMKGGPLFGESWKLWVRSKRNTLPDIPIPHLIQEMSKQANVSTKEFMSYGALNAEEVSQIRTIGNLVRGKVNEKFHGFIGKLEHGVEAMVGSPYVLEQVGKYGSLDKIPTDVYFKTVMKDIYTGTAIPTALTIGIGVPLGYGRNKYQDNEDSTPKKKEEYNTIEGLNERGLASRLRKTNSDFGSGWDALRGLVRAEETFAQMLATKEFRMALVRGKRVGPMLGTGVSGEVVRMKSMFRGQEFEFARKIGNIGEYEVAAQRAAQETVTPTVYRSKKGVIDMELFKGQVLENVPAGAIETEKATAALAQVHKAGYVHSDPHLENLMRVETPRGWDYGVIDLGGAAPIATATSTMMKAETGFLKALIEAKQKTGFSLAIQETGQQAAEKATAKVMKANMSELAEDLQKAQREIWTNATVGGKGHTGRSRKAVRQLGRHGGPQ